MAGIVSKAPELAAGQSNLFETVELKSFDSYG